MEHLHVDLVASFYQLESVQVKNFGNQLKLLTLQGTPKESRQGDVLHKSDNFEGPLITATRAVALGGKKTNLAANLLNKLDRCGQGLNSGKLLAGGFEN